MIEFFYRPQVFYGFYREEKRSDRIERERDVNVLVATSYLSFWWRRVLFNSDLRKQQSTGDMKNNIQEERN